MSSSGMSQACMQLGRNTFGIPGHVHQAGQEPCPMHTAVTRAPRDKENASREKLELFRLAFFNFLKLWCNLNRFWFLMEVSACNEFLVG